MVTRRRDGKQRLRAGTACGAVRGVEQRVRMDGVGLRNTVWAWQRNGHVLVDGVLEHVFVDLALRWLTIHTSTRSVLSATRRPLAGWGALVRVVGLQAGTPEVSHAGALSSTAMFTHVSIW